ncbi:hypothetical protein E2542_SST11637 [Spatholobus suberectus]|nr:hypothetical protein E2542_SST11637 [Spatholobus suberectus]
MSPESNAPATASLQLKPPLQVDTPVAAMSPSLIRGPCTRDVVAPVYHDTTGGALVLVSSSPSLCSNLALAKKAALLVSKSLGFS